MLLAFVAFLSSTLACALILATPNLHHQLSGDHFRDTPQQFHEFAVPRIGGLSIALGILCAGIYAQSIALKDIDLSWNILLCALPSFAIGLFEDCTKSVGVKVRLLIKALSAALFIYILQVRIVGLDIALLDYALATVSYTHLTLPTNREV